ncbi:MAG TPA: YitT family protein, partial [Massilibacterium sp.]|nr:YitT family protein [Massilibacterium sp.]
MKEKPALIPTHSGSLRKRILLFVSGLFVLSFGVVLMIQAGLGVNPWDVLHIGLSQLTGISIGAWVQIVGVTIIILTSILAKQWPQLGMLFNIFFIGWFINLLLQLNIIPTFHHFLLQFVILLLGIICMGFGIGMYVASNLGPGPRDWLTLVLVKKTG